MTRRLPELDLSDSEGKIGEFFQLIKKSKEPCVDDDCEDLVSSCCSLVPFPKNPHPSFSAILYNKHLLARF